MIKTNHSRLFVILCLSMIMMLAYSACVAPTSGSPPSGNSQAPEATQPPAATEPPQPAEPCKIIENITHTDQCVVRDDSSLVCTIVQENGKSLVTITLRPQDRPLDIVRCEFGEDITQSDYIRRIMYVQVIDPSSGSAVHEFSPPLEITAEYTPDDLAQVDNNPDLLRIGIYNHTDHVFTDYIPSIDSGSSTGTIIVGSWTSHACWKR